MLTCAAFFAAAAGSHLSVLLRGASKTTAGRWSQGLRSVHRRTATTNALVYESFGQPEKVVKLDSDFPVEMIGSEDVAVDILACPINPSDINTIQGVYPLKPEFPAVGGGEGVGVVRETGEGVTSVRSGDWVIPSGPSLGTWREMVVAPEKRFVKIDSGIGLDVAATLTVNPPTAYRMLKDFVNLEPGDCVIQNGGNSGVGLSVSQLARAWGIHCISVIRDRPGLEELVKSMKTLGATEVVTEDFAASHRMKDLLSEYKTPKLGFNCVGGKSSATLLKHLGDNGVMVNYGGMAKQPVTVPVGYLIFKDVKVVGYWNSKWLESNLHSPQHHSMMEDLCRLALSGHLRPPPTTHHPLSEYKTALTQSMEPYVGSKQIILMNQ